MDFLKCSFSLLSWVITINWAPKSVACFFNSLITFEQLVSSKLEVGSSAKINLGEFTIAKAIEALCFSPWLNWFVFLFDLSKIFNFLRILSIFE